MPAIHRMSFAVSTWRLGTAIAGFGDVLLNLAGVGLDDRHLGAAGRLRAACCRALPGPRMARRWLAAPASYSAILTHGRCAAPSYFKPLTRPAPYLAVVGVYQHAWLGLVLLRCTLWRTSCARRRRAAVDPAADDGGVRRRSSAARASGDPGCCSSAAPPIFALISAWSSQRVLSTWAAPGYTHAVPVARPCRRTPAGPAVVRRLLFGTAAFVVLSVAVVATEVRLDGCCYCRHRAQRFPTRRSTGHRYTR